MSNFKSTKAFGFNFFNFFNFLTSLTSLNENILQYE